MPSALAWYSLIHWLEERHLASEGDIESDACFDAGVRNNYWLSGSVKALSKKLLKRQFQLEAVLFLECC